MNKIRKTQEIFRTKMWHVDPRFVQDIRPMVEALLDGERERSKVDDDDVLEHNSGWFALKSCGFKNRRLLEMDTEAGDGTVHGAKANEGEAQEDLIVTDDPKWDMTQHWWDEEGPLIKPEDQFINVIDLTSSVTRNGGWCSAGSIEHRDQMIYASKFPNCIGHIFIVDTPGGSAYSKNDYQQGIEAARAAGQPVLVWIDGLCASAGVAASVQADEIYVQHPNCEIGCIGTMAAFYTLADGTKDDEGYVWHELYDPESFDKNAEFRELANNDNDALILADLAEDGAEFREMVRQCRPAIKEEMLHGKIYKARDVMGILVDGVKSFEQCIDRIVEINGGAELISHVVTVEEEPTPAEPVVVVDAPEDNEENSNSIKYSEIMKNQYPHFSKAMGLEENAEIAKSAKLDEEGNKILGFFCNDELAKAADQFCAEAEVTAENLVMANESLAKANETIKGLNAEKSALAQEKATLEATIAEKDNALAEKNTEIANANAKAEQLQQEIDELKANAETANTDAETANTAHAEALAEKDKEIEALRQQIADKEAEINELSQNAPAPATPAPAQETPKEENAMSAPHHFYEKGMTSAERAKALEERMKQLKMKK